MKISNLNYIEPKLKSISRIGKNNCLPVEVSYGKRVVESYELDYITWGEGYIITDGEKIPARKGTMFFREPGMIVEGIAPYHCYFLKFDLFKDASLEPESNIISRAKTKSIKDSDFPKVLIFEETQSIEQLFRGV